MTIKEFSEKYYFHDVSFENIYFDKDTNVLILTVTKGYDEDPWWPDMNYEMMIAILVFEGVTNIDDTHKNMIFDSESILESGINENNEYELISSINSGSQKGEIRYLKIKCEKANLIPLYLFNW